LDSNDNTLQFDSILIYKRNSCFADTSVSKFVSKIERTKSNEVVYYLNESILDVIKGQEIDLFNTFVKLLHSSKKKATICGLRFCEHSRFYGQNFQRQQYSNIFK
jgi:hypothetical protein